MAEQVLIVEDEDTLRESLRRVFLREDIEVDVARTAEDALTFFEEKNHDIILTDIILPGMNGIELLKRCREQNPDQIVIIMTAFASIETAIEALRGGAYDYIVKPVIHEEVKRVVRNAQRERALSAENTILKKQIRDSFDFEHIIGESDSIKSLQAEIRQISDSRSNVLILGETGTGKELFARALHYNSFRKSKPFIPINCGAIPENLLESELFGYVKGAFTGAATTKRGLFAEADGGSVFLDEIGDMSLPLQAKLLRIIDDHEIRPLGGTQSKKVDIRILAATNRDVVKDVREGRFREDLFYRINVVTLNLPSLRDRKDDIPILADFFLRKYAHELGKQVTSFSDEAMNLLASYWWPGNVRELKNIIERAVLLAQVSYVRGEDLPSTMKEKRTFAYEGIEKKLSIEDYTKEFIKKYQNELSEQKIANLLGITRKSLWEKRKKWGLNKGV